MRNLMLVMVILFSTSIVFTSCRETTTTTKEVRVETIESKGAIERAGEKVDSKVNEEIDKTIDKIDSE
ncbi:hypothetical protein SAMN04488027_11441 [Psychroflexus sediminis]|uniref:Uncharacterized protein n=4 Tax=Psychroflexus TaxID=83612 RepID=A0A1G7YUL5_9FLAO|nr:hypothetical protein SAMN04488027_11441 [Psychroflexus sediminis]